MSEPLSINHQTSALMLMDFQGFVLNNFLPEAIAADVVSNAAGLLEAARTVGMPVIHVMVSFRPGYPEISPRNTLFSRLKDSGMVASGSDDTKIHLALAPKDLEPVVAKHRVGAFTGTDLERLLRAKGVETLVLAGVTTAGVVLSTVRQAFDLDYNLIVASNGCADADREVHAILLAKVISQHAAVLTIEEIKTAIWQSSINRPRR